MPALSRLPSLAFVALLVVSAAFRGAAVDQARVVASNDEVRITHASTQAPLARSRAKSADAPLVWAHLDGRDVFAAPDTRGWRLTTGPTRPAFQIFDHTPTGCRPPPRR